MSHQTYERIRENYKRASEGLDPRNPFDPRVRRLAEMIAHEIGLTDAKGKPYLREDGFPQLAKDRRKTADDFHPKLLAEAIIGHGWEEKIGKGRALLYEEATAPIGPSYFMNVSAWTAAIGGLIQGQILEGYETAPLDALDLFPTRPVVFWQGGERLISIIGPSLMAPEVGPGQSHPDAKMDGMWVEPGPVRKYGLKLLITRETQYVDITGGQILARAKDVGFSLRLREQDLHLEVIVGNQNNFKLGLTSDSSATGYNTYGATVPAGPNGTTATLANDIVNPMVDPLTTFNASQEALLAYKHPVTGIPMPMASRLTTVLIPSNLQWFATYLTTVKQLVLGTQPPAPGPGTLGGNFPTAWSTGDNPFAGLFKEVKVSQWLYNKHTDPVTPISPDLPVGQGLSVANSRRWYRYEPATFAARRAAWEATTIDLSPNDYVLADQGTIAGTVCNIALMVQVLNPWAIQRNKVA